MWTICVFQVEVGLHPALLKSRSEENDIKSSVGGTFIGEDGLVVMTSGISGMGSSTSNTWFPFV